MKRRACTSRLPPGRCGRRCANGASAAATILEVECHRQNAPDGGNREQAFGYQTFVLDFLLLAGLAARARGEDFSPVYWRRLEVHDRFPRVDDQRRGRVAHDRRRGRWLRGAPRARGGFFAAWFADRHRRGAVRPAGSRGQGGHARQQDRHPARRERGAHAGTAQTTRARRIPSAHAVLRVRLLPAGRGASRRRTRCGCWSTRVRSVT